MAPTETARPDLTALTDDEKERVLGHVRRRRPACPTCGGTAFGVGEALFLGFLFLGEPHDAYMVALSCRSARCPDPHSGIKLHGPEFLDAGEPARAKAL